LRNQGPYGYEADKQSEQLTFNEPDHDTFGVPHQMSNDDDLPGHDTWIDDQMC